MPTTRYEKIVLAYALFFGIVAGFCLSGVLQAIALPNVNGFILTIKEHQDSILLGAKAAQVQLLINLGLGTALVYLLLFLPLLNPHINSGLFSEPKKLLRFGVYTLAAVVITVGLSVRLDSFFGSMNDSLFMRIVGVAVPIIWWSILGEIGVAGDFSSWKPRHNMDIKTCILLAISSYFIFIILTLADNWGFLWFFTLVSEVLSGPGDISVQGFSWLQGGMVLLTTCTSVILAATIIALAPCRRELRVRTDKLIFPILLTIGFTLLLSAGHYYGNLRYDLNQPTLARAIGAENDSQTPSTYTAILQGETISSIPWHNEISTFAVTGSARLAVSSENIGKLQDYLAHHPQSVHRASAKEALVNSHFNLWDSVQATTLQAQTLDNVLQRLIFLNRLSCLPVTPENQQFLVSFEDGSSWWVGSKAALRLAYAAVHFNMFDTATRWHDLAKERGASEQSLATVTIPSTPLMTHGIISGSIDTTRPLIIGLFRLDNADQRVTLDTSYLSLHLVASQDVDQKTTFAFNNIGSGQYFLALKYTGEMAEIGLEKRERLQLDTLQPAVDVGLITVR